MTAPKRPPGRPRKNPIRPGDGDSRHGTRAGFLAGCTCPRCVAANGRYYIEHKSSKRPANNTDFSLGFQRSCAREGCHHAPGLHALVTERPALPLRGAGMPLHGLPTSGDRRQAHHRLGPGGTRDVRSEEAGVTGRTVWKYTIGRGDKTWLIPGCERLLTVQVQEGVPVFWAVVRPDAANRLVRVEMVVTGGAVPDDFEYLGTFQEDWFVGHVFWRFEESP